MLVQHADINVGPANYKHLKDDELLVTKIFYTIQGEGPYAGQPAIFLRLAGCNRGAKQGMGCEFCDTAFYFSKGTPMSFEKINTEFRKLSTSRDPLIVITGGEPMMQNNIGAFLIFLDSRNYSCVQIESNGDRVAPSLLAADKEIYTLNVDLVICPKVVRGVYRPLDVDVFNRADYLKILISADEASPYNTLPLYTLEFNRWVQQKPVYLSPMTVYNFPHDPGQPVSAWDSKLVNHEATAANYTYAAVLALKHGLFVSMQQHLWYGLE